MSIVTLWTIILIFSLVWIVFWVITPLLKKLCQVDRSPGMEYQEFIYGEILNILWIMKTELYCHKTWVQMSLTASDALILTLFLEPDPAKVWPFCYIAKRVLGRLMSLIRHAQLDLPLATPASDGGLLQKLIQIKEIREKSLQLFWLGRLETLRVWGIKMYHINELRCKK